MSQHETTTAEPVKDYLTPLMPHEEGVTEGSVVSVIEQAEYSQMIATARRYPRSITQFRRRMYEMVTIDIDTASSCIYALPRDGKVVDGPSIRFAELLIAAWGNNRAAAEVTNVGDEFVTAMGTFFDLETNAAVQGKVMRNIMTSEKRDKKTGEIIPARRFSRDMIVVTGNAACSIALRNAVLRGVPKALWIDLFGEAKKVASGDAKTFITRRDEAIKALGLQHVTPDAIFALFGIKGKEDMTTEHVVHLRGLHNAIRDGEVSVDDVFKNPGLKPGEVVPPRPERSAFERPAGDQASEKKAEPEAKSAQADAPKEDAKPQAEAAKEEPAQDSKPVTTAAADAFKDWYADQCKTLESVTMMRSIVDLDAEVSPELEGEMLADWQARCSAMQETIKAKKKEARGGK